MSFQHVCACIDDHDARHAALATAAALRADGGRLSAVHAATPQVMLHPGPARPGDDADDRMDALRRWLGEQAAEVGAEPHLLVHADPAGAVTDWALQNGVDLLVLAAHHGRLERALTGSFAQDVAHLAPCAVMVTRPVRDAGAPLGGVAAACVDDDASARRVVAEARALGAQRLVLVHARGRRGPLDRGWSVADAEPPAWLAGMARETGAEGVVLLDGAAGTALTGWAEDARAGVLIVAARANPGPAAVLGSVTSHLVVNAPCPVLVARHEDRRAA
jgi:nucleotide-binding universal stress UspA family protein